jgi:HSP20 family protein
MTLMPLRRDGARFVTVSPIREFEDIYDRMAHLLSAVGDPTFTQGMPETSWVPAADITETDDAYLVEVELPGVDRADIDVSVDGNDVIVSGELRQKEHGRFLRRSRRVGRFELRATLPGDIDPDGVAAELEDGVLVLMVPKARSGGPRHVQISEGSSQRASDGAAAGAGAAVEAPSGTSTQPS